MSIGTTWEEGGGWTLAAMEGVWTLAAVAQALVPWLVLQWPSLMF